MSYWVYLLGDHGEGLPVERFVDGGTYPVGGETVSELNVTYNYSRQYAPLGFSLKDLDGQRASDTELVLAALVEKLGTADDSNDYWAATPGNAGKALNRLLLWARRHPHGVWRVS